MTSKVLRLKAMFLRHYRRIDWFGYSIEHENGGMEIHIGIFWGILFVLILVFTGLYLRSTYKPMTTKRKPVTAMIESWQDPSVEGIQRTECSGFLSHL